MARSREDAQPEHEHQSQVAARAGQDAITARLDLEQAAPPGRRAGGRWQRCTLQAHTALAALAADAHWTILVRMIIPFWIVHILRVYQIKALSYGLRGSHAQLDFQCDLGSGRIHFAAGSTLPSMSPAVVVLTTAVGALWFLLTPGVLSGTIIVHWLIALALPARPGISGLGIVARQARLFAIYLAVTVPLVTACMLVWFPHLCTPVKDTDMDGVMQEGCDFRFVVDPGRLGIHSYVYSAFDRISFLN